MKPQFSSVPMTVLRLLDNYVKGRVTCAIPKEWTKADVQYMDRLRGFVKDTTHFEHPDMSEPTYVKGWGDAMRRQLEKGLHLPHSPLSIYGKLGGEQEIELFAIYTNRTVLDMQVEVTPDGKQRLVDETPKWDPIEVNLFFRCNLDNNINPWGEHEWLPFPFGILLAEDLFKIDIDEPALVKAEDMCYPLWKASAVDGDPLTLYEGFFGDYFVISSWMLLSILTGLDEGRTRSRVEVTKDFVKGVAAKLSKNKDRRFYDIHRLVIHNEVQESPKESKGGTHASPRWHKRRGYWRTMKKSGKQVWVSACEVGSKSNGMVYKDYEVKIGE